MILLFILLIILIPLKGQEYVAKADVYLHIVEKVAVF
jgi:hypothetical protein